MSVPTPELPNLPSPVTLSSVNRVVLQYESTGAAKLHKLLLRFAEENADPLRSPNYNDGQRDDLTPLANLLHDSSVVGNRALTAAIVRVLKICTRKAVNRNDLPATIIGAVVQLLGKCAPEDREQLADLANFVLNVCYRPANAVHVLAAVPHLIGHLGSDDDHVRVAAAGALQSVCMHEDGKACVVSSAAVPSVLRLLGVSNVALVGRCAGLLHNISTTWPGVLTIRDSGGLPVIIGLLDDHHHSETKRHAAAVLQNCSRDPRSVEVMRQHDAVARLARLLFLDDLATQMPATGALLNWSFLASAERGVR
eukprot:GGOE01018683.1.p1 GENE.GGOE01018683.1~~GGOE01018683.1.p1  ORF type:complete len:310 (+),score=89.09 GGOE01018683.1:94-1023(+)